MNRRAALLALAVLLACAVAPRALLADEAPATAGAPATEAATAGRPPGEIRFVAQNRIAPANGRFKSWRIARASIDEAHPEKSEVVVVVDLASIDTDSKRRDDHLRNADFFDVERFPTATARLSGFRPSGDGSYTADVALDLHGTTGSFPMKFRVTDRAARRFTGEATIKRTDFGIGAPHSSLNPLSVDQDFSVRVEAVGPAAGGS